ncbi:MAG: translation initiation factor IF-2 [Erysipelotrichia bacterium]|jgi:translation initiation factor IF-2|nr:translation initiation factor IF-2 [Erysipelotrichia bacterium]
MKKSNPKKPTNRNRRPNTNNGPFVPRKTVELVKEIKYTDGITVGELAEKLKKNASEIIKLLFMLGKMVTINSIMDDDLVELVCLEFNVEVTKEEIFDETSLEDSIQDNPEDLVERPAVVTIMGHVDHGKTTLLDTIRKSKVVSGEFGGITQHIGAYQVTYNKRLITFLDTPGHEAFTAMRARGAKITDLVIIVVAADDGVMPQTKEALDHAKAAGVPIIVAVNKMDKESANPDKVMNQLADLGLTPEEWGGDTIYLRISALKGQGINEVLETILVLTEVENLRANPKRDAVGTVIEAKLDKGRGPVTTLLVQNGTLRVGDPVVVGACFGKVRKMTDDEGKEIKEAGPATPVEIIGLNDVPQAGDIFKVFTNERHARAIADKRSQAKIETERRITSALSLDDLSKQIKEGNVQEIPLIIKADVQGSAEAVRSSLEKIDVDSVKVNVIRNTAGAISESDVMLAAASKAIIIGFNVRPTAAIRKLAQEQGVDIRLHNIIYKVVEQMEAAMKGMLDPIFEEIILGQASVRQIFKASRIGTIAGCMVTDGKLVRNAHVRLIRDGVVVYTGRLSSLKRFSNDVKEVTAGFDCGCTIENFNDIKEGDLIEAFGSVEVERD